MNKKIKSCHIKNNTLGNRNNGNIADAHIMKMMINVVKDDASICRAGDVIIIVVGCIGSSHE